MTEQRDDLDLKHLFRIIFLQGGQVAVGTAIGAGVLLLVGVVGVLLSPVLVPLFLYLYWRQERAKKAPGQDVTGLTGGGAEVPPGV